MKKRHKLTFTLDYWKDDGWYVGKIRQIPSVVSQGKSLRDLRKNIREAMSLVVENAVEDASKTLKAGQKP